MTQIFDPVPKNEAEITCLYVNATSKVQIIRITNIPNWYFERVIFPGQRLIFKAVIGSLLEVHTGTIASSILSDTIPCSELEVKEEIPDTPEWVPLIPISA
ncbi:MAG: hypothetical protein CV045_02145 [Cyanobacteria bacterium M5B4]|nr:DUF1830 domain-containing protein [Cyanobacteria bacterium KgW148]PLS69439.1 MAG: hypothetical protein CV045_02145 [Cyanobacteria bacterium M5B4]